MKKFLRIYLPVWALLWSVGCWGTVADASEVLMPEVETPAPKDSSRHHLSQTADGRLLLSWVEQEEKVSRLRFTVREKGGWSTPRTVVTAHHKFTAPPVVLGLSDGALAAVWMVRTSQPDNPYVAELYFSRSTDGGKHWSEPLQPYSAKARIYDAQMSLAPLKEGRLALVWTDQRYEPRFQIRATVVDAEGNYSSEILLDKNTCSCCETDTVAQGGALWTAYRDRLKGEVRDIGLVHWSSDGPAQAGIVHDDHWVIAGCPSNGPAVDSRAGLTMVTWFTAAADNAKRAQTKSAIPPSWKEWRTASDGIGRVLTAFSHEGVGHFGQPIEVDANTNGYVNALLLEDGSALVAWRGRAGPTEELQLAQVRQDGTVHHRTTVYRGDFPPWPSRHISLIQVGDSVYVAWTDPAQQQVRLVTVPLSNLTAAPGALAKAK